MRWNKRQKVERPEYPKLIPVTGTVAEANRLLTLIQNHDPAATILDGGERGAFLKVHDGQPKEQRQLRRATSRWPDQPNGWRSYKGTRGR